MLPKVAIVGRPNVGKSSLLNMLANRRVSIVDPTPGVTRDRVSIEIELPPYKKGGPIPHIELIDTGGYGVYSGDATYHILTEAIEAQIDLAIREAQLLLFVVDAQTGPTPLDRTIARLLREKVGHEKKLQLVANKVDGPTFEADALEFSSLGLGEPLLVSANTKVGKWVLYEFIRDNVDFDAAMSENVRSEMLLAIIGKRNAGKSTLVNALAGSDRVIASEMEGTTRDSVDVQFQLGDRTFTAIDTAGVRKRKSLQDDIEYYSLHRALRSIRRADVVVLLIDATLPISQVDKKLSQQILEHHKPCLVVLNKWDLVAETTELEDYVKYVEEQLRGLDFCPMVAISAKESDHIEEVIRVAISLHDQANQRVGTGELNGVIKDIMTQRGPSSKLGRMIKVFYATQVDVKPPTIVLFVNHPDVFDHNYQRYMMNQFRDRLPYPEVPIKLVIRGRSEKENASKNRDQGPVVET